MSTCDQKLGALEMRILDIVEIGLGHRTGLSTPHLSPQVKALPPSRSAPVCRQPHDTCCQPAGPCTTHDGNNAA
eukprot:1898631-Pleurochrysis_carterae.AAC.2